LRFAALISISPAYKHALPQGTQLYHFGFGLRFNWDYIEKTVLIIDRPAAKKGPRRVNVGRQESGRSGKESAPAATTATATVAKINRASRKAGIISWGG
jgi:hypothetical protein